MAPLPATLRIRLSMHIHSHTYETISNGYLAWSNWRARDLRSATQQYADALRPNPQQTCAWVGLVQLCEAGVEPKGVGCSLAELTVPDPEHVLNWRSDSGMTLVGFIGHSQVIESDIEIR